MAYKITKNFSKICLDVDDKNKQAVITAYFESEPGKSDLEALDDIETNTQAHSPNHQFSVKSEVINDRNCENKHDFTLFAWYKQYD